MSTKSICTGLAVTLGLLTFANPTRAATQYDILWNGHNHPYSCITPGLATEGQPNFFVNDFPIPTYTVGGSLTYGPGAQEFRISYHAPFSGTLFRVGHNDIQFASSVDGNPDCAVSDDTIYLNPSHRLLFALATHGPNIQGATDIDLSLREVDPNLADALDNLKRAIRDTDASLRAKGEIADQTTARLEELQAELDELLAKGFDEISPEALDALLAQFDGLPPDVRDALVGFLRDLQRDIAELRTEIARVASVFADRVHNVDGVADGAPGFDPQDPGGFTPIATGDPPPIDIPEVLGDDPWNGSHDPYAQYADEVLETLQATVHDGAVVQRATFLQIYGAWRYNIQTLENILQQRSTVTVREWGAFLDAKGRVLGFLEQYIDRDGWMRDAPVTPQLRAMIEFLKDLDAAYRFKLRAQALQLAINLWNRDSLTERQNALLDILVLFDEAMRARIAQDAPAEREDGFWSKMEEIADVAITVADVAVSFTPVGHFLDLCRAISGRALCIAGDQLTTAERVAYGAASVIGGGAVWKAAAGKVRPAAAAIVRTVGDALDNVVKRRPQQGIVEIIEHAGGAKTYVHESGKAVRYSREGFPDFSPYKYKGSAGKAEVEIELSGSRSADETAANVKAGFEETPEGYTWHHHEETGKMILIETQVHRDFAHTGGFAIWKKLMELLGK